MAVQIARLFDGSPSEPDACSTCALGICSVCCSRRRSSPNAQAVRPRQLARARTSPLRFKRADLLSRSSRKAPQGECATSAGYANCYRRADSLVAPGEGLHLRGRTYECCRSSAEAQQLLRLVLNRREEALYAFARRLTPPIGTRNKILISLEGRALAVKR